MRLLPVAAPVLLAILAPSVSVVRAAPAPADAGKSDLKPEEVRQAIDRAIAFLKSRQSKTDGGWPEYINAPGGVTALSALALLSAGVPRDDEALVRALRKIETINPDKTYVAALQTMVFCQANPTQYRAQIRRNVAKLYEWQIKTGQNAGAWSYPAGPGDNSNAQFALLALHEAELAGIPAHPDPKLARELWTRSKNYWEGCQNLNGSWGYSKTMSREGTGSMTAAGIGSLIIVSDRFRQANAKVQGDEILCCQQAAAENEHIDRGVQWLGRNFHADVNPGAPGGYWLLYYLYAVERVGRLTNQRFLGKGDPFGAKLEGKHDWYREGAEELIRRRQDGMSGYFKGPGHVEGEPVIGTSLGLLFLAKGRRPVLMAKLQHSVGDDWNLHRNDVDNLTQHVEKRWKRELTWQVVNLHEASIDDLLQSPVLYFCGNLNPLPGTVAQREKMALKFRDYLDRGGFVLAEAYGGGSGFDQGFRELMRLVFPEPEYRLRMLEPEHPIWRMEGPVPVDQMRPLEGIDFGCRTSVVYVPQHPPAGPRPSLSCLWELSRPGREEKYSDKVQRQIDAGLLLGANILAYATNREVQDKAAMFRPATGRQPPDKTARGKIFVAKLRHPGGCNAAPRALVNLLEAAGEQLKIRAQVREELINASDEALMDQHLVFMHGRTAFRLTDAERANLKTFLERGGMLVADSICTSQAFSESFRREMAAVFPDRKLERIPPDDPIWTPAYGGFDLKTVERRDPPPAGSKGGPLQAARRRVPPDLEGIKLADQGAKVEDRWAVVFSQYDLSCALEKHDSLECRGYSRQDAARIGLNLLLYSLQQ